MDDQNRLGQLLVVAPQLHARLAELRELGPAEGSRALTDLDGTTFGELVLGELVRSAAVASIGSALDHLVSWGSLYVVSGLLPAFAQFTMMRATVEGASTTRWLVDPTVGPRVRVARGIGQQLADLGERNRIERLPRPASAPPLPVPPTDFRTAAQRIATLEDAAAALGLCPLRIGHTEVVSRYGLGEFGYRLLSAFAHGGQAIPFAASSHEGADAADAGGLRTVRLTGNVAGAIEMTDATIRLARGALVEVFAYHGHAFDPTPAGGP